MGTRRGADLFDWIRHPIRSARNVYNEEGLVELVLFAVLLPILFMYLGPFALGSWLMGRSLKAVGVEPEGSLEFLLQVVLFAFPVLFWLGLLTLAKAIVG